MGIFRGSQNQEFFRLIEEIEKAGIPASHLDYESDDLLEHFIEVESRTDRGTDLVQDLELLSCQIERLLNIFKGIRTRHNSAA